MSTPRCCYECGRPEPDGEPFCACGSNHFVESAVQEVSTPRCCYTCDIPVPDGEPLCPVCGGNYFVDCAAEEATGQGRSPGEDTRGSAQPPESPPPVTRPRQLAITFVCDGQTARHDLAPGEQVALGRDPAASPFADAFARDDLVGRLHAIIVYGPDGTPLIRDMYSTNGTYVNEEEMPPGSQRMLADGDKIRLGGQTTGRVRSVSARLSAKGNSS